MKVKCKFDRRAFLRSSAVFTSAIWLPQAGQQTSEGSEITLATWPHRVYKENDGILQPALTESCVFNLIVRETQNRAMDPIRAHLEFYSAAEKVHTVDVTRKALEAIRSTSIAERGPEDREEEVFDLRHYFSFPVSLGVDRLEYALTVARRGGSEVQKLNIPLLRYQQKTKLIFPIKGKCWIGFGHHFNEPHSDGRSQHFAYDIQGLGPNWEIVKGQGAVISDWYTWAREIISPSDGKVLYARNDVPDNLKPGRIQKELYANLPEPDLALPGNNILLDHGNGEYSSLGHMRQGSVRVRTGDRVKQEDVLGEVGNTGASPVPHLHYQLVSDGHVFLADGLPSRFDNISFDLFQSPIPIHTPKRGALLVAH
jgi:hypothetical protein